MYNNRKFNFISVVITVLFLGMIGGHKPAFSVEQDTSPKGKAVLVTIDQTSWEEIYEHADILPNLTGLAQQASIGLMNTKTAGDITPASTFLTIGAGSRLDGKSIAGQAYNAQETVENVSSGDLYFRRTGHLITREMVVQPNIPEIIKINSELRYPAQPGALGQVIQEYDLKTAVLGNADAGPDRNSRNGVSIVMDVYGRVDMGMVDDRTVRPSPTSLSGWETDYQKLLGAFIETYLSADLIVVELGDVTRIGTLAEQALPEVAERQRVEALKGIDTFVGQLIDHINLKQDMLWVVSPTPSPENVRDKRWFTPVMVAGPAVEKGLLTSGTTKRPGIIANTDIAPSILQHFGIAKGPTMTGQVVSVSGPGSVSDLLAKAKISYFNYLARPILVQGYISLEIVLLLAVMLSLIWVKPHPRMLELVLISLTVVPLVLLLLPLLKIHSIIPSILITLSLTVLATIIAVKLTTNRVHSFVLINFATFLAILADVFLQSPLMKQSVLGYDAMEGARYYGIGNEYMGVLIGAAIMGTIILLDRVEKNRKLWIGLIGLIYLVLTYAMAAPNLGTNVGGTISAVAGFGVAFMLLVGVKPSKKSIISVVALVVVVVGAFIAFDLSRPEHAQSHIGRTARMLAEGGWSEGPGKALDIITRKMAVNLRLIKYTKWSKVFAVNLLLIAVVYWRFQKEVAQTKLKSPNLVKGFWATLVSAGVALVFNDSGIVAAATMVIFGTAPLVTAILNNVDNQ